jgi:Ca2+-binding RTX toxin-like protein
MAKYIAKQPFTSNAPLQGLSIFTSPSGSTFDPRESDHFVVENETTRLDIGGEGFSYFGGRPKLDGTITSIKYYYLDEIGYKLTDAKIDLRVIVNTNDAMKISQKIFSKDDVLKGTSETDILYGFKGKDKLIGNGGADALYGGGGKDTLIGGDGADTLDGAKGKDTFVFKSDPKLGADTLTSFDAGDRIELKAKFFAGLSTGELAPEHFVVGSAVLDGDDRILYDPTTGYLWHDADGTGSQAATLFAVLPANLESFDAGNILVI